ncbi:MAG: hypothetical protein R2801_04300 [Chitinophagales bacterium]
MRLIVDELKLKLNKVYLGGGEKRIAKEHSKRKLTARERIAYLIDAKTDFLEIALWLAMICMKNKVDVRVVV